MAPHQPNPVTEKCLSTWVPKEHYERFRALAKLHGVNLSEMLRAIIADVLAEEETLAQKQLRNSETRISA